MISVSIQAVSKRFDKVSALDAVSLDIDAGELFFLLGPSGCGKTTALRTVAGFYQPDEGRILFGEKEMTRVPPHKRNTGMVFQNYALWPHLTCRGNVEYGLKVRKTPRDEMKRRVDEALEMVRLGNLGDRYPNQLSGGQQQRVALARALVIRPDVLLLDEPLSNLDAQLRLEMRREIKRLHLETKVTAIYVTHDQNEALSIADRMAIMRDGKVMQVGTPRDIYRRPNSRFVAEFIGETNFVAGKVVGNDAQTVVETALGTIVAAKNESVQIGQDVWCSIRPEAWRVGEGSPNSFPARIDGTTYLGETEQLGATLTGGHETSEAETWRVQKISVLNPRESVRAGETVVLSVAPEDVAVLAE
ncbi:MAG TPA: ABC transporter ATP-binding protein [Abditibacteriaceae bacterium]|jgi:iron(III) transport system ATP-binding protein